jgi:hypothetical protein
MAPHLIPLALKRGLADEGSVDVAQRASWIFRFSGIDRRHIDRCAIGRYSRIGLERGLTVVCRVSGSDIGNE